VCEKVTAVFAAYAVLLYLDVTGGISTLYISCTDAVHTYVLVLLVLLVLHSNSSTITIYYTDTSVHSFQV